MTDYDDYYTHDDKPLAEHLNDALLLSNVFDFTVPIQLPRMFKNGAWLNNLSPRKAGVAIITLDELMNDINITTDEDGNSILEATSNTSFGFLFYPNFNSFGSIYSVSWEGTGGISVDLYTKDNQLIQSNISKGVINNSSSHLRELKQVLFVVHMPGGSVLNSFEIVMKNKTLERYGAEVGISDVTNLQEELDSKVNISSIIDSLTSQVTNQPLSAKMGRVLNNKINNVEGSVQNNSQAINTITDDNTTIQQLTFEGFTGSIEYVVRNGWVFLHTNNLKPTSPSTYYLFDNLPSKIHPNNNIKCEGFTLPTHTYRFDVKLTTLGKIYINSIEGPIPPNIEMYFSLIYPLKDY